MKIIGISGKKYAGKDTLCNGITATLSDVRITRIGFADALKDEVCAACGVTREYMEKNKALFRPILQWWGTEFRRNVHGENYWIDRLHDRVQEAEKAGCQVVIITDVRFQNEYDYVAQTPRSVLLRVNSNRTAPLTDKPDTLQHTSETALDTAKFEYVLHNDTTLEQFQLDVARFTNKVLTQRLALAIRDEPARNS